jgi:putative endonuclease
MSTKIGNTAEDFAASYLESQGWEIIVRNHRTKYAEIDIIAVSKGIAHIIEVKYRRSNSFGGGLDYITPDKIRRLRNAAIMWATDYHFTGDYQIDIISVEGSLAAPNISIEQNVIEY